jgi:hypothetical protein
MIDCQQQVIESARDRGLMKPFVCCSKVAKNNFAKNDLAK